jgi:hypothetical protein
VVDLQGGEEVLFEHVYGLRDDGRGQGGAGDGVFCGEDPTQQVVSAVVVDLGCARVRDQGEPSCRGGLSGKRH